MHVTFYAYFFNFIKVYFFKFKRSLFKLLAQLFKNKENEICKTKNEFHGWLKQCFFSFFFFNDLSEWRKKNVQNV